MAILFVFAGLPGTGKSTISRQLARRIGAVHLRIDTIEQALRDLCDVEVTGEGYRFAYRIAADNLRLGLDVVADSCNPIELTRDEWQSTALECGARFVNIEVVCSDSLEHRQRVETRRSPVAGLRLPTWDDVENREYHRWTRHRIVIDTAGKTEGACFDELLSELERIGGVPDRRL